jgi:hypothetical protein
MVKKTLHWSGSESLASVQPNIVFSGEKFGPPPLFITALVQFSVYVFYSSVLYPSTAFCLPSYSYNNSCFELNCLKQDGFNCTVP